MKPVVFLGPTLAREEAVRFADAQFRPPVAQGDVYKAIAESPPLIAIVDGYFEGVPAVWHKEILYALDRGIPVIGAASMGALRAAELAPFGMEGLGLIYEQFRDGCLEDDDEVAVVHGPAELGFPQVSLAMVDIRFALQKAVGEGVIDDAVKGELLSRAKALHYKDRCLEALVGLNSEGEIRAAFERLIKWWPSGYTSQKRTDAIDMLRVLSRRLRGCDNVVPSRRFHFERTLLWERNVRLLEERLS